MLDTTPAMLGINPAMLGTNPTLTLTATPTAEPHHCHHGPALGDPASDVLQHR